MQWLLALSDGGATFHYYAEMAKVAIHTALKFTCLRPHLLYDGGENDFTDWVRRRNIPMVRCQSAFLGKLANLEICQKDKTIAAATRGIFLRVELPMLQEQIGLEDRVLYTDCDVMFQRDVVPDLAPVNCEYFAAAGEFNPDDYENMNTGVLLMNLPRLRETANQFREFISENLESLKDEAWDQGAFRRFYRRPDGTALWDKLPAELNWKPYWGKNPGAGIIHFHGPKPFQSDYVSTLPELQHLSGGAYGDLCQIWSRWLAEAN